MMMIPMSEIPIAIERDAAATAGRRPAVLRLSGRGGAAGGLRESNPVGRGRYTPGRGFGGAGASAMVPPLVKLPWIPSEQQWREVLELFAAERIRNRVMLALAYGAALRREELCSLRTDDLDPAHRMLRVRAETTKTRRERMVPYSAPTGALMAQYLAHRGTLSRARGPLFLSESRRNHGEPLTLWTWSKVVHRVALAADVPRLSTHTMRHLCFSGWPSASLDPDSGGSPRARSGARRVYEPQNLVFTVPGDCRPL
jgi:integrase/recombinase XerD